MRIVERFPLWLRIVHWLNTPFLTLMIWSGLLIYWANDIYFGLFPEWFYQALRIDHRLAEGLAIHFTIGWFFVLNGLAYLVLAIGTRHFQSVLPSKQTFRDLKNLHALTHRKSNGTFNGAQRIVYSGIVGLGFIEVLSGFAIYKPVQLSWLVDLFGGYKSARLIHFIGMLGFSFFIVVHVLQVARSGWNTFRAMVAGFEVEKNDT